jgi:two-component system cell cycle sensor histidine kinase/response regulator CckA
VEKTIEQVLEGNETILLVEDEEILRTLAKNFLEAKGYRVLVAMDGHEAISVYAEHQEEIDLVLSDLGLPKIGGQQMFMEMRKIDPEVRVILCSGFLQAHFVSKMLVAGVKDFILKPYTAGDVLQKIRGTLAAAKRIQEKNGR